MDHVDVLTAADGRPRGCGTVLLSTKADASRAIGEFVVFGLWHGGSCKNQRDYSNHQYSHDSLRDYYVGGVSTRRVAMPHLSLCVNSWLVNT